METPGQVRLCLSMSDYHPESWNPSWSIETLLVGLQSFMYHLHHIIILIRTQDCLGFTYVFEMPPIRILRPMRWSRYEESNAIGSLAAPAAERGRLAQASQAFNVRNQVGAPSHAAPAALALDAILCRGRFDWDLRPCRA